MDYKQSKIYDISEKTMNFITEVMKNWKIELTVGRKSLPEVEIYWDIILGDEISTLLFY